MHHRNDVEPRGWRDVQPGPGRVRLRSKIEGIEHARGRSAKKPIKDAVQLALGYICPDEWLIGPFEQLRGKGYTVSEILGLRAIYCACVGVKNAGLPSLTEVWNRSEGKIPLPVVSKEPERKNPFTGLTEEELNAQLLELAGKVQKLLPSAENKPI